MGSNHPAGKVVSLEGDALALTDQGERLLSLGSEVFQGETIVTRAGSSLEIDFADNTSMSQGENSRAVIDTYVYDEKDPGGSDFLVEMSQGVFRTVTGEIARQNPDQFKLKSPMALIGIRGTVVNADIQNGAESIGVETIGKGHVLVVQDSQGNIQFISDPVQILDILQGQALQPPRPMTRDELDNFQRAAPNAVDQDPARQAELDARLDVAEAEAELEAAAQDARAAAEKAEAAQDALDDARAEGDAEAIAEAEAEAAAAAKAAAEAEAALKAAAEAAKAAEDTLDQLFSLEAPEGYEDPGDTQSRTGSDLTVIGLVEVDDQGNISFYSAADQGASADDPDVPPPSETNDLVVNAVPDAVADTLAMDEDRTAFIDVLANDHDADGDALSIIDVTQGAHGRVVNLGDGITYVPDADFSGVDTFTYMVSDGNGGTDTAAVTVTVNPVNDAPKAVADNLSVSEDSIGVIDVLGNDSDIENDSLQVESTTAPSHGQVTINADQSITYVPDADFNGTDAFSYTVSDGNGGTDTQVVTITVDPVNDAPEASADTLSVSEDSSAGIDVLANDTDPDNDTLKVESTTAPSHGQVTINSNQSITYVPDTNFNGTDSFTYTVSDGNGATDTAAVAVTVEPVNDAPEASADTLSVSEDSSAGIDVLANDTDPDNDTLQVESTTAPSHGQVTINSDQSITYVPDTNFNGTDSFTYTVSDGNGATDTAAVAVTVEPVNDAPEASADTLSVSEDSRARVDVLANDTDPENDPLQVESTTAPSHGQVTINSDQSITYVPDTNFNGTDSFTYTVSDGNGATDTAAVAVTVNSVNDAPEAVADSLKVYQDTSGTIHVLANDNDIENNVLQVESVTDPLNGQVIINSDQSITYVPDEGFSGQDSFTYTVSDGHGGTDAAAVAVIVNPEGYNELVNTLGGESGFGEYNLERTDDSSSEEIDLTSIFEDGLYLYGQTYTSLYINANGNLTFGQSTGEFTPEALSSDDSSYPVMIAPFWADVETEPAPADGSETPGGNSTGSNLIYYDIDAVNHIFTVTWDDVGHYSNDIDTLNAFQVQLIDMGSGDFDIIFRYEDINWETGDIEGIARMGISAWDGINYIEMDPSGNAEAVLALEETEGTSSQPGYWVFNVRDGIADVTLTHDAYDDTLEGTGGDDTLRGQLGDDLIKADAGDDLLFGESGNDTLAGGDGSDTLWGGTGEDLFVISDSSNKDFIADFDGDRIQFQETDLGFEAKGTDSTVFSLADNQVLDPTQYTIIGINDQQAANVEVPWSNTASVIDNALDASLGNGADDATYVILNNGTGIDDGDARLYYWEGDTSEDGQVNDTELTLLAEFDGMTLSDIGNLQSSDFEFA